MSAPGDDLASLALISATALWLCRASDEGLAPVSGIADQATGTTPVTDAAWSEASDWAMTQLCAQQGYGFSRGACAHTQQSCSAGPGRDTKPEKYGEWVTDEDGAGRCVNMDQTFAKWCTDQGLSVAPSASGVHTCVTNRDYCRSKVVSWSGSDCRVPPGQWLAEAVFGTTITRGARWIAENPQRAAEDGARLTVNGAEYVVVDSVYRPVIDPILRGDVGAVPGNVIGVTQTYVDRAARIAGGTGRVAGQAVSGVGNAVTGLTAGAADRVFGQQAGNVVRAIGPGRVASEVGNNITKGAQVLEDATRGATSAVGGSARSVFDSLGGSVRVPAGGIGRAAGGAVRGAAHAGRSAVRAVTGVFGF